MTDPLLVVGARVDGWSEPVDVRVEGGTVVAIGSGLDRTAGTTEIDGAGAWLLPGLHDHHIHLMATAADARSVRVGPPEVRNAAAFARVLQDADRSLAPGEWVRATGYHHAVAGDLDRTALDRFVAGRPVRVQDRSGARWTLNTAAVEAVGLDHESGPGVERDEHGRPTGRVHRADAALRRRWPGTEPDLAALGAHLAARGVTAVTDTTPYGSLAELEPLAAAVRGGALPQRVVVTGGPELAGRPAPAGLEWGPVKLVIDDGRYPAIDELVAGIRTAHDHDRPAAIHCVTRVALALAVAAWDQAGALPGDRVEHGSVVPPDLAAALVRLGLTVVTQPGFVAERGDDYLSDVDPDDVPHLYRCRSLQALGIPVLGSTDAPYTRPDPWPAIEAAVARRTPSGAVLGADERLPLREALALFTGPAIRPGAPADLCLVAGPLAEAASVEVRATVRAGEVLWATG